MPKKKSSKKPFGSKSGFVRGLPKDMPAKEVVSKAKAEGMTLSVAQVYNIRSTAKLKKRAGVTKRAPVAAPRAAGGAEAQLRKLIAEVGLSRAREVMAEVSAAFGS